MLNRIVALSANQQQQVRGNIKRVIIRRASGPVLIETDKSESIEVRQGDNIRFENVCSVMSITDLSGMSNRLVMVLVSDAEGDVTSSATAVEIANTAELTGAAPNFEIHNHVMDGNPVEILAEGISRRQAVITTSGKVSVMKSAGGPTFTVDGVLVHDANGALLAQGDAGVEIEVLEYLN